jgi:hypothetical protein
VVSERHSCFKACQVAIEDAERSGWPSRKCWKNLRTQPWRPLLNNPWARRRSWDQLQSLPRDRNRKFEHAPHCCRVCSPYSWQMIKNSDA